MRATIIDPSKSKLLERIKINVADKIVELEDESPEPAWCLLEIPVKADLNLSLTADADIENLYCDELKVSGRFIKTNNLNTKNVDLTCTSGGIDCQGILLGQHINLKAENSNISLNKIQGEKLVVHQSNGIITTNSIYSTFSTFDCNNSTLNLKNIHKICQIFGAGTGELNMNGFYGTLLANLENYKLNLQLSELVDENQISSKSEETAVINVAEKTFEDCYFCIKSGRVVVDKLVQELNLKTNWDSDHITLNDENLSNQLRIRTAGDVLLGKLAWADSFSFTDNKLKSFSDTQFH